MAHGTDEKVILRIGVDEMFGKVDSLMLTIFEAMRQTTLEGNSRSPDAVVSEISGLYEDCAKSIDNLVGIDRSKDEQEKELLSISSDYSSRRIKVLQLTNKLQQMEGAIDEELLKVYFTFSLLCCLWNIVISFL